MPSILDKIKSKTTQRGKESKGQEEQQFTIQPHPAKTNDPADLQPAPPGGGLRSDPVMGAHHARDPHIPSPQIMNNMPAAMSREEYAKREAELNR
ncbi:hypothetical protein BDZ89DRAFT_986431 [Hymenopellis radicata]|nr:hypothetical protein BDZ89DRAFT_986431 [Hymenopellis radicata]